jgi:hypothetical protein
VDSPVHASAFGAVKAYVPTCSLWNAAHYCRHRTVLPRISVRNGGRQCPRAFRARGRPDMNLPPDGALRLVRDLIHAASGQLLLLEVVPRQRSPVRLADAPESLEQQAASPGLLGGPVGVACSRLHRGRGLKIVVRMLLVLPLQAAGGKLEPSARHAFVERMVDSVGVPVTGDPARVPCGRTGHACPCLQHTLSGQHEASPPARALP